MSNNPFLYMNLNEDSELQRDPTLSGLMRVYRPAPQQREVIRHDHFRDVEATFAKPFQDSLAFSIPIAIAIVEIANDEQVREETAHMFETVMCNVDASVVACTRPDDLVAIVKDKYYVLFLKNSNVMAAAQTCERIKVALNKMRYQTQETPVNLELRFGLADGSSFTGFGIEEIMIAAHRALQQTRQLGTGAVAKTVDGKTSGKGRQGVRLGKHT